MKPVVQLAVIDTDRKNIGCIRKLLTDTAVRYDVDMQVDWITDLRKTGRLFEASDTLQLVLINLGLGRIAGTLAKELYQKSRCYVMYYAQEKLDLEPYLMARPIAFHADLADHALFISKVLALCTMILQDKNLFIRNAKSSTILVRYRNIRYFESNYKNVTLYTSQGRSYTFRGRLDEISRQVPASVFLRVHQSYLVNLSYVERVDKSRKSLLLNSGEELQISKPYYEGVIGRLLGDQ